MGMLQKKQWIYLTMLQIELQALTLMSSVPSFKASTGWMQKFMKRHGLVLLQKTKIAQKLPDDLEEKIVSFHRFVLNLRKEHQFDLNQIGNMDKTLLCFDSPPNRTIESKGNKTILICTTSHERAHFTVVLACMANGTKLKPMVIFKRKAIPEREKMPPGVLVHCQSKGWMDEDGILLWLYKVWDTRPGALLKKKSLLVWDQF